MLSRSQRLTSSQFARAFANSQVVRHPLLVGKVHLRDEKSSRDKSSNDDAGPTRAAFVVPKKQGKATQRNRVRRRLQECYRLHPLRDEIVGADLIFLATPQTAAASLSELNAAFDDVLRRLKRKIGNNSNDFKRPARQEEPETLTIANRVEEGEKEANSRVKEASRALPLTLLALFLIRFYQRYISPGLPPSCRFEPSCSRYTYAAIERFGLGRGVALGCARLCRCNPWHKGGFDPVPELFPPMWPSNGKPANRWNPFKKKSSLARRRVFLPKKGR